MSAAAAGALRSTSVTVGAIGSPVIEAGPRRSLDSVYVRRGKEPVAEKVLVFDRGADYLEKPTRGNGDYRVTPVSWPADHVLANQLSRSIFVSDDGRPKGIYIDGKRVSVDARRG